MEYTERLSPCRKKADGSDAVECRPAEDIIVSFAGDYRRLKEIAECAIDDPDSQITGYSWTFMSLSVTGTYWFEEGQILNIEYLGKNYNAVIFTPPRLQYNAPLQMQWSFDVAFLVNIE